MIPRGPASQLLRWPAALLALLAACATSGPKPSGPEVDDIDIEGTRALSESDIKKKILTSESGLGFWPFGDKSYFDPNAWQADLRRIERYYQAHGYYQAQIVDEQVVPQGHNKVDLRVKVVEGEPTLISKVEITGLDEVPAEHRGDVLRDLPLKKDDVLQEENWAGLKQHIQTALRDLGYAEAEVGGEVTVDVATHRAEARLEIKPGTRYHFGDIHVVGADHVSRARIIEQAAGAVQKTDWFSESALAEAQARVFKMGVFGAVRVNRAAPDQRLGTVPVIVDVRESPFHTQKVGAGAGLDQTRQEVRISAEHTDRNFLGNLRRLTIRGKLGYAFLPGVLAVVTNDLAEAPRNDVVFNVTGELEQPRFLFRDLRGQLTLGAEKTLEPAFSYIGGRMKGGVIWQPTRYFSIYPSYNLDVYQLSGTITAGATSPTLISGGCPPGSPNNTCLIGLSYVEQTIEWDQRDNKNEPHDGLYFGLSLQEGGGPLGGSFTFFRALPDARVYASFLDDRLTLAARVRLGTLIPTGNDEESSLVTRFFSGGGGSNRGFDSRRLSPLQVVPVPETRYAGGLATTTGVFGQTVPIGGNGMFESNFEVRYQVSESVVLAAFFDAGFVTSKRFQFNDPSYLRDNMQYSVGLGLRYVTLVGPIRMDFGYRIAGPPLEVVQPAGQRLSYPVQSGCFGLFERDALYPGRPEGTCAFHLSIGEAF